MDNKINGVPDRRLGNSVVADALESLVGSGPGSGELQTKIIDLEA